MNYSLNAPKNEQEKKPSTFSSLKKLLGLIRHERRSITIAFSAILINSALMLIGPLIIGYTIDHYVETKNFDGVLRNAGILLVIYLFALIASYLQTMLMGSVGQRMLYTLRNAIFTRLQELPVAFFNQNKAGDLISRINNDTDKLNQFFSQSLMRFIGSIVTMLGAGIFLLSINVKLGAAALAPAALIYIFTKVISPWIRKKNSVSLKSLGGLSSEIQESLQNFKVIIAFNRRDYFRERFNEANEDNYNKAVGAGLANNLLMPVYGFFTNLAQMTVLLFGIYLIANGEFTVGLLVSFLAYANSFYHPLRQLAVLWSGFQIAMAGWDRITEILAMESDLKTLKSDQKGESKTIMQFENVRFAYPNGKEILHNVNFRLEKGKTYALVGPTGGGKTTTASLIARLYDPTSGNVFLDGRDIRSFTPDELSQRIGFILQEPFLFSGTVRENIIYGNTRYANLNNEELEKVIIDSGLKVLLDKFESGLETKVSSSGDTISLGQKQLIAFMRAVLRDPDILILDEATANIDTMTEQLLESILKNLSNETTRVIIAHRLNTIENADEIFFVNSGELIPAGSMDHAVDMLMHGKRAS
ncbi:MAG: ATP-binding cassette domain-containing protein [Bacteroidetes bacterium]|nr:ATP-binding cassette domain-containing protein [Bacteroidota bacterium]